LWTGHDADADHSHAAEHDDILFNIVADHDFWLHHFDPETKWQSME
jgi:hypothetical protein